MIIASAVVISSVVRHVVDWGTGGVEWIDREGRVGVFEVGRAEAAVWSAMTHDRQIGYK